jgi:hypothetical protein
MKINNRIENGLIKSEKTSLEQFFDKQSNDDSVASENKKQPFELGEITQEYIDSINNDPVLKDWLDADSHLMAKEMDEEWTW